MGRDRDEFSGRYNREYDVGDFVEALKDLESASTSQVAEEVGCSRDLAYRRLKELKENGVVSAELIGGNYRWSVKSNED